LVFKSSSRAIVLIIALIGCEEILPPRVEPEKVLESSLDVGSGSYSFTGPWPQDSRGDDYEDDGNLGITFQLKNLYDEVLQDSVYIKGSFVIQVDLLGDNRTAMVEFNEGGVFPVPQLGLITMEPGDSVRISASWDHHLDNGDPIWFDEWYEGKMQFIGVDWSKRQYVFRSGSIPFTVTGSVQIFENVPAQVVGPVSFLSVYYLRVPIGP
jgi:hypothetical protein